MNPKNFEKSVDKIATVKKDIYDRKSVFLAVRRLFHDIFDRDSREIDLIAQMRFWKKGFPDQDNPGKLSKFLDKFSILVFLYDFIGDNEVKEYLKQKGITVTNNPYLNDLKLEQNDFAEKIDEQDWYDAFGKTDPPDQTKDLFEQLVNRYVEILGEIFESNEVINEEAEAVEATENIKKGHVQKAAQLRFKELMKKKIVKDLKKIGDDIESVSQAISIFEKEEEKVPTK